jgi:hypothetical protein
MAKRPTPVIDAVVNRIRAERPVVAAVIDGMRNAAADPGTSITPVQVEARSAEHIAEAVAPLIVNANNDEPVNASRVVTGTVWVLVSAFGLFLVEIAPMLQTLTGQLATATSKTAVIFSFIFGGGVFGGGALALYGRLKKGLPPMTFNPLKPWTWLAPRPSP